MGEENSRVRAAWDANAEHWDQRMAEGNAFALRLIAPSEESLLAIRRGTRVLDVACGNGLHARRLARRGATVLAVDVSPRMIELARQRTPAELDVEYRVVDAANEGELAALPDAFDAAVCHMAVFDMERVDRLFAAVAARLRAGDPFVVSSVHPCFNSARPIMYTEVSEQTDPPSVTHGVRIEEYLTPREFPARAFRDSKSPHPVFHRPLSMMLGEAFRSGFVLTGVVEPAFAEDGSRGSGPPGWDARFHDIPPVIVYRFEKRSAAL
jgi:SAM-dependent methyltransferase